MDRGKYIDFHEDDEPNTFWGFVKSKEGKFEFKKYHANHAKLGDSDSVYCSLPESLTEGMEIEDIVNVADGAVEHANSSYAEFLKHAFNCPESRTHHIESNREIVADAVFVASKKRYAAHVIDDEGSRVDKLKIMGLEIKRSDTSEAVKDMLYELVKMILDGKTQDEILTRTKEMKKDFMEMDLKKIGKPTGCKGLIKYTEQIEKTGSMKGVPYQVRSVLFYNSLCGPEDKKVDPGEKVTILYIKDHRSKYIAFPSDINTLPSFMDDLIIDYDTQWQKAQKKLVAYLSAVGYDLDSRREAKRQELFGF